MAFTILAVDVIFGFQLVALPQSPGSVYAWKLELRNLREVADILLTLGLMDQETASRLQAGTTITPQHGIQTLPLSHLATLIDLMAPEEEPVSPEAQEGYMLCVQGEVTEEELVATGFIVQTNKPLQ